MTTYADLDLREASEAMLAGIKFLGQARAASDAMAFEIELDMEDPAVWRDRLEPVLMKPYDALEKALLEVAIADHVDEYGCGDC